MKISVNDYSHVFFLSYAKVENIWLDLTVSHSFRHAYASDTN